MAQNPIYLYHSETTILTIIFYQLCYSGTAILSVIFYQIVKKQTVNTFRTKHQTAQTYDSYYIKLKNIYFFMAHTKQFSKNK